MTKHPEATPQNLYQITGNVADMNTVLIERAELRRLHEENQTLREKNGLLKYALTEHETLQAENAELEAMLDAVGAGGVGQSIQPPVQADTVLPVSVPTGWKLVPVEPTDDMFIEGMEADCRGRPSIDDDKHVRSIWRAMMSSAPDAPAQPPAATDEPQLNGDAQLAHQQCRAVAHLARSVANAYDVRASMVANDAQLANLIGETSAAAMERLGDELNSMDSASETDDWLNPIFDAAQQRWPGNETDAPQHAAQQAPVAGARCKIIDNCKSCQHSAGRQSCMLANRAFEGRERPPTPPDWCPLPLYTAPQPTENLHCKSTQKRLATLWGYVKQEPARKPLTDEQIIEWVRSGEYNVTTNDWASHIEFTRAIEAAHGITGGQQ